ncbi:hypothetical protein JIN84_09415 [Luteolibacter yonseiensis]|uniref:Uncharacterized protein n=1 Tax=Luteolibacter yonseiensis TaxID=1144680 RepID=A0A934R5I0_9BACT|nr:hypothetical protein [Luteolibacter yonseiensis]MBK1815835.1 hypothetical protein [Luteolibacter yonseiensis]
MNVKLWNSRGFPLRAVSAITLCGAALATAENEEEPPAGITWVLSEQTPPVFADQAALDERRAIVLELEELAGGGASPAEMEDWRTRNAARITANQERLTEASRKQNSAPQPYVTEVMIPADASETMENFQMERASLANQRTLVRNEMPDASPEERAQALADWDERNADALAALASAAARITSESSIPPQPLPTSFDIPAGATPALRDFLILRNGRIRTESEKSAAPADTAPDPALLEAAARLSDESKNLQTDQPSQSR